MASLLGQAAGPPDQYENLNALLGHGGGMPLSWPMRPGPEQVAELAKLGINLPDIQKNILFPNIASKHPLLGGAAEGAVLGAAFTPAPTGPEGAGAGISRAAQGIMAVPQFHRQMAIAQMMAPLQMAGQVQELKAAEQERQFRGQYGGFLEAQAAKDRAWSDMMMQNADVKKFIEEQKLEGHIQGFMQMPDGTSGVLVRDPSAPGGLSLKLPSDLHPGFGNVINQAGKQIGQPKGSSSMMFGPGMSVDKLAANALLVKSMPGQFSKEDRATADAVHKNVMSFYGQRAGTQGGAGEASRLASGGARIDALKDRSTRLQSRLADINKQLESNLFVKTSSEAYAPAETKAKIKELQRQKGLLENQIDQVDHALITNTTVPINPQDMMTGGSNPQQGQNLSPAAQQALQMLMQGLQQAK